MAITTYTELKAAVASWLHRDDLTTEIEDFIALAESEFTRQRFSGAMSTSALSVSTQETALPTDWYATRAAVVVSGGSNFEMTPLAQAHLRSVTGTGVPRFYACGGGNFIVAPEPSGTFTVNLSYWAKVPSLSGTTTTNWLLEDYPDLYLWRAVYEGAKWCQDTELQQSAMMEYGRLLGDVKTNDAARDWGPAPETKVD